METFFSQHFEVAPVVIYALILTVCWFMIRTIRKIDENQTRLFEMYKDMDRRLSWLQGAHDAYTGGGGHHRNERQPIG